MGRYCLGVLAAGLLAAQPQVRSVDVGPHLQRAEQAVQRGDLQGAVKELQEAVRLNCFEPEAHGRLGLAYRKLGRPAEAAKSLERAVELRPDPRLKVLLAFTYIDVRNYSSAIPLLKASLETEQSESVQLAVVQRLVECYLSVQQEEQALPYVQRLRQMAPHDPNVLYLSSKVYMNLWNGAFQLMLARAPNSYHVRLIQAEALEAQERFGEAAPEYREILKIAPQLANIHYQLGRAILQGQTTAATDGEALAAFRKELELNPSHTGALTEIGELHLKKSEREEASRTFLQAIQLNSRDVRAKVGLAKVLIGEKQWGQALEHLEAAVKLAPYDEAVFYNLMLAYRGLGRAADAKQALDTFQSLSEQKKIRSSPVKISPR